MDIRVIFPLIAAIASLCIAFASYAKRRLDAVNRAFATLSLFIVIWSLSVALFYVLSGERELFFTAKTVYFTGGLIASSFFYFAVLFAYGVFPSRLLWGAVVVPQIILFVLYYFSGAIIRGHIAQDGARGFLYGPAVGIFYAHFAAFFGFGLAVLARMRKNADFALSSKVRSILLGSVAGVMFAGFTNIFMPWRGNASLVWLGPFLVIIWPFSIAYGIRKHRLFNVRIITAELLVFVLWIVLLVRLFLSETVTEISVNVAVFFALVFLGAFLVRSVNQEVRHGERAEALAKDLATANLELKKLDVAKSEFISIAAHQLRAPLTVIRGYVSMLREGSFGAIGGTGAQALANVETAACNLIVLVNSLLNLSRIESGTLQYQFQKRDFAEIVGTAIEELRLAARNRGLALRFVNDAPDLPLFFFDADKLREVAVNFIDNAIKYSGSGSGTIDIVVERVRGPSGDAARLSVRDRGVGVNEDDARFLFVKFSRLPEAKKIDPNGMGIGLYFVKRIVEDHGGRTGVLSEGPGKGSVFFAELPIREKPVLMNNTPQSAETL